MRCPKCDGPFGAVDSRPGTADLTGSKRRGTTLVAWARSWVGWWSDTDWIVRRRVCTSCGHQQRTIEILEADLPHLIRKDPDGGDNVPD